MTIEQEPLFSAQNFARLQSIMQMKAVKAGHNLFGEGDAADKLYYIKQGQVRITKAADNGRILTLYQHVRGDMFGQIDPFRDSVHAFNAVVMEEGEIGIMKQKDLEELLMQHGDLAIEFMKWMGLMHRMTQMKLRDLMMFGKSGALCSLLIRLSNTYGEHRDGSLFLPLNMTHSEMADMVGTTRESVNRMLNEMKKEGIIAIQDGYILIHNLDYLRERCHCECCPQEICRM
ncbi:Crp/Fnr family transcriptional regulator [Paenibacillus montanisoli]|uniref:Crp/Fnr family transcriptional regulator n=2 Tax=Paenibacillus montanisoli TaxID=2081970 RepID=A0A328UA04_9BACL|nr:Crp/Fnr family transcriptional regulator [Paenibacillus montanisoli]